MALGLAFALPAQAALRIAQLVPVPDQIAAGGVVTNQVSVADDESAPVAGGSFGFAVPAGANWEGGAVAPGGASCTGMAAGAAGPGTITCSGITLAAGETQVFALPIKTTAAGVLSVTATAPANSETKTITVSTGADLGVAIAAPASAPAGSTQTLQFTITNHGPYASPASSLVYSVPPGFAPASLPAGCSLAGSTLTCAVGALAVGASSTIALSGSITAGSGSTVTHTANIVAGGGVGDGVDANNTATASTSVAPGTTLALAKSRTPAGSIAPGETFDFVLAPSYSGDYPAGLQLVDHLPANFSFVGSTPFSANGWTCTASSVDPAPGPTIACTKAGSGGAGSNTSLGTVTIAVKALGAGLGILNTATLSATGAASASGNAYTDVVAPTADFRAYKYKSWPQPNVPAGTPFSFGLGALDLGPSAFPVGGTITLTDNMPAGLRITRISSGDGFACTVNGSAVALGATLAIDGPAAIVCTRTLASAVAVGAGGGEVAVEVVAPAAIGTVTNTMCVATANGPADTNAVDGYDNNCASVGVGAQASGAQADVSVLKRVASALGSSAANRQEAGQPVTWEIEIVNAGPQAATNVSVTDDFGQVFSAGAPTLIAGTGGAVFASGCTVSANALSGCVVQTLPVCTAGDGSCPRIRVAVAHTGDGASAGDNDFSLTNRAYALAESPADPTLDYGGYTNSATATAYFSARADVSVAKAANPATVAAGQLLTYTITASNLGTSSASRAYDVSVTDTLPANLVFLSATPSGGGSCTTAPAAGSTTGAASNNQLVCGWSRIDRGNQQTVTVKARPLVALINADITNGVTVATVTPEVSTANNSASATVHVGTPAYDLRVQKTDDADPADVGDAVTYTITVANAGASTAENVRVVDTLPTTMTPAGATPPVFVEVVTPLSALVSSCTLGNGAAVGAAGGTVECLIPVLGGNGSGATGEASSAQIRIRLRGTAKGSATNHAAVSFASGSLDVYDSLPGNNSVSESTYFRYKADVEVAGKTAVSAGTSTAITQIAAGQVFDWLVSVRNNGPESAETTTVADTLPAGMAVAGTPVFSVTAGAFDPTAPGCNVTGQTVSCAIASMPAGGAATLRIPVKLTGSPANGSVFTNTASIVTTGSGDSNGGSDPGAGNNHGSGSITAQTASVAGRVYADANGNGTPDAGESGIAGVTVTLTGTDASGNAVTLTTTTDASGAYGFAVPPGSYTLTETQPAAWQPGLTRAGTASGTGSSAGSVPTSGAGVTAGPNGSNANQVVGIVLGTAGTSTGNNFGEVQHASLAGRVYRDADYSGAPSAGDPGIAGVAVALTGTDMFGNAVAQTTTSAAGDGAYAFANLWPGSYALAETQPAGYIDGPDNVGSAGGSNATKNQLTGIALGSGTAATAYDFGEWLARVQVQVFEDANNDGSVQGGEAGIAGVVLHLSGTDANGNPVDIVATAVSGQPGVYQFLNVPPSGAGGYTITETQPAGYAPGKASANGNPGTPDASGNLIAGVTVAAGGSTTPIGTYLFGELVAGGVSGHVYYDRDADGVRDAGEPGIAGVVVHLSGTGVNGSAVSLSTTTDANGYYAFPDAGPGTYTLTEERPSGYQPGITHAGTVSGSGSVAGTVPASGTGVRAGSLGSDANTIVNLVLGAAGAGSVNNDFSAVKAASLAGSVYADVNPANGVRDPAEAGIAGVTVKLTGTDFLGAAVERSLVTDADGHYGPTDLAPGTYRIDETQPAGYADGPETLGSVGGSARGTANPSGTNDRFGAIALASEEAGSGYDFGERGGQLAGHVYVDSNGDGVRQSGEPGIAGVTLTLAGHTSGGQTVSLTVTTDASGAYAFDGLLPSDAAGYTITETQPAAYADGADAVGRIGGTANGTLGNDVVGAIHYAGGAGEGYDFGERGASLAGKVYNDVNDDGRCEDGELPLAGVTVTLTGTDADGNAVTRTATTDADGRYKFTDLPLPGAGGYTLTETQPAGFSDGGATVGSLGGSVVSANQSKVGFATPGVDGTAYDFYDRNDAPASLAGTVWRDADHDRTRGGNEAVLAGWTVELLRCADGSASCTSPTVIATALTGADGGYRFENLVPGNVLVRFRAPDGRLVGGVWPTDPVQNAAAGPHPTVAGGAPAAQIAATVTAGAAIVNQDLPLDPGGIVYDSLTAQPVAGAVVTLAGPAGFDAASHLYGGTAALTTAADGYYDFFLLPGAPAGDYTITVSPPAGYVASATYPAASGPLDTQTCSAPGGTADTGSASPCIVAALAAPVAGSATTYYLGWRAPAGGGQHVVDNHIPLDPLGSGTAIELRKTTSKLTVKKGELVPYAITATNTRAVALTNVALADTIPPGFKYVEGSLTMQTLPGGAVQTVVPAVTGRRLSLSGLSFAPGEVKRFSMVLGVGVGVGEGQYVNQVVAEQGLGGTALSNVATASVRVVADALFDCTDVIGKVYDDRNANGYQDDGEPGLANVRVATVNGLLVTTDAQGRYHIACAAIPKEGTGSNFVLKLDERTLPSGYRTTTENPAAERATRGKVVKINFGATVHRVLRLDLRADAFAPGAAALAEEHRARLDQVIAALAERPSVLRLAYRPAPGEDPALADARIAATRTELLARWKRHCEAAGVASYDLDLEVERVAVAAPAADRRAGTGAERDADRDAAQGAQRGRAEGKP